MITNERQYKISKSSAERFRTALADFDRKGQSSDYHPALIAAQRDAMRSQLDEILADIAAYEALKNGARSSIKIDSFSELAEGLISARIAAGLSQKALADRLGLKEQQIQRYESERFVSASLQRLQQIASAIGVEIRKEILLPSKASDVDSVFDKFHQAGLTRTFVESKLLSPRDLVQNELVGGDDSPMLAKLGEAADKIFGWTPPMLFGSAPLSAPRTAGANARFKMPVGRSQSGTSVYTTYANYLATVVLDAMSDIAARPIPTDPNEIRGAIEHAYGGLSFVSAINYLWDNGVPVLPLRDEGAFHGASWRYDGRNVIVLKQVSRHADRWLYDLLHEAYHAGDEPERLTHEIVEGEETSRERRESDEEIAAARYAGDVVLGGQSEELAQRCVRAARNSVELLKSVVPTVAADAAVSVGALANYLAFRLSWQGVNWWGAAANLQPASEDPWTTARDIFLRRFAFERLTAFDRALLQRALS
jgi:transcriptional regulator with XRE-family HTH domain